MGDRRCRVHLEDLVTALMGNHSCGYRVSVPEAQMVIAMAQTILMSEPVLLQVPHPAVVVGDLHGQFPDLLRILAEAEAPPSTRYVFNGDFVDRGPMSVEVIMLLLALKVKYPRWVYLLRGNHETRECTAQYGFRDECLKKLNSTCYEDFCNLFDCLPLAAVIGGSILVVHGGLSPELYELGEIMRQPRPIDVSVKGMLANLLWSDPSRSVVEWAPSPRGDTLCFGLAPAKRFLERNQLSLLIRSHEVVEEGWEYPFHPDHSVITVFSAPCYAGELNNRGAYLEIDGDLQLHPRVLPHQPRSMQFAWQMAKRPVTARGRMKPEPDRRKSRKPRSARW